MLRSMTGFGVATAEQGGRQCSVEVRSVNNRFFKAAIRVPPELTPLEAKLESQLGRITNRGSVTVTVVPMPGWESSETAPPWSSISRRTSARPRPAPAWPCAEPARVKGSKISA